MGKLSRWVGGVLFFVFPSVCFCYDTIEAYGDSVTAGFMSRTDVTHAPSLLDMSGIISDLAMFFMTGDSAFLNKHHAPELAWPNLLAARLGKSKPLPLDNHAVSGARAWSMVNQVKAHSDRGLPARAFFFIGHNDLCNNLDSPSAISADFKSEVALALAEWDRTHSDSIAYLIPIAQIGEVYKTLDKYVWHKGAQAQYSCVDSWTKFFPYCISHYQKHKAGLLDAYLTPRRNALNQALATLSHEWNNQSQENRFEFLADTHNVALDPAFFAVDCFHLSPAGQRAVADRVEKLIATL